MFQGIIVSCDAELAALVGHSCVGDILGTKVALHIPSLIIPSVKPGHGIPKVKHSVVLAANSGGYEVVRNKLYIFGALLYLVAVDEEAEGDGTDRRWIDIPVEYTFVSNSGCRQHRRWLLLGYVLSLLTVTVPPLLGWDDSNLLLY